MDDYQVWYGKCSKHIKDIILRPVDVHETAVFEDFLRFENLYPSSTSEESLQEKVSIPKGI
jgi:hypothetical protein